MLELGGEAARRSLQARVNSNRIANPVPVSDAGTDSGLAQQAYNAEEAKVQLHGDTGQGTRLTDAKRAA